MSGTSMDGVDLSVIKSDGNDQFTPVYNTYKEFDDGLYKQLISLRDKISNFKDLKTHSIEINDVEKKFTLFNSHLINEVIGDINEDIDLKSQKIKISQKIDNLNRQINALVNKLKNKAYIKNAPKEIVQNDKKLLKELTIEDSKLRSIVSSIN